MTGADDGRYRDVGRVWRRNLELAFADLDAVLTPAAGTVAPRADESETIETTRRLARLTYGFSTAKVPALVVPCGFSSGGLPVGMQIVAPWWQEETLLSLGPPTSVRRTGTCADPSLRRSPRSSSHRPRRISMRIKYIVPFPFDEAGIANRAAQLPDELRRPASTYDFVPVE